MSKQLMDQPPKRKTLIYVDGFNLYHRAIEGHPERKWLCLDTLAKRYLFPNDHIASVKYFTAMVDPYSDGSPKQNRQRLYWKLLASTGVKVIEGRLEKRDRDCKSHACSKYYSYPTMSEKMSDVSLALNVYRDFLTEDPDIICVVSADLDILPALKMVREHKRRVMIVVYLPGVDDGMYFSRGADFKDIAILRRLNTGWLKASRFADKLSVAGEVIECPKTWRVGPGEAITQAAP